MKYKTNEILNKCIELINHNNTNLAKIIIKQETLKEPFSSDLLELLLFIEVSEEDWINAEITAKLLLKQKIDPKIHNNLGYILNKLGRYSESVSHHRKAIDLDNTYTDAYNNLGISLIELNQKEEALLIFEKAIKLDSTNIDLLANMASVMSELKKYKEAIYYFEKAIAIDKDNVIILNNYANALKEIGEFDKALKNYDKAIEIDPHYVEALFNRTDLHREIMNFSVAFKDINLVLKYEKNSQNYCIKGHVARDMCLAEESVEAFKEAINYDETSIEANWCLPFSKLIPIYNTENIGEIIISIEDELIKLKKWIIRNKNLRNMESGVGAILPFYLAYQSGDNKKILEYYGDMCSEVMKEWQERYEYKKVKITNKKIRIGIVSSHVKNHSVWNAITKGIVLKLNKKLFSICIFNLGKLEDLETNIAINNSELYYHNVGELADWHRCIVDNNCDILIYPEIGMHALTFQLACLRIAKLQLCMWGHPETSGLKTIDYFISAEMFENESSGKNYSEKLIKLPNLGTYLLPQKIINHNIKHLDYFEKENVPIIICAGALHKYEPKNDWLFIEIIKKCKKIKFLFFSQNKDWEKKFHERMQIEFTKNNLEINLYIQIIPFLDERKFSYVLSKGTIYMDSIGFSGFNTAIKAIEENLPIVSLYNDRLKGNLANGLLLRLKLKELIANSYDEYFEIINKILNDENYRQTLRKTIQENKKIIYEDDEVIHSLENFILAKI